MSKTPIQPKLDLDYFENILLFNALSDPEYLSSIVSHLDSSLFVDKSIGKIVSKITEFFSQRGSVPTITELKARMTSDDDRKALDDAKLKIAQLQTTFNKDELAINTERFLRERFIYKTILNVADKFSDQSFQIEEALVEFEKAYNITLSENLGHWYFEDIERLTKELTSTYNPIPTGWKFFDDKCEGGLFPKTLTVFAGQVNVGKSIVLGNIAANMVLADKNVLLITLEMSEFMYAKRISSQLTQIPHGDLKTFTNELKEQVDKIKKTLNSRLVIKEYPPKTVTVRQMDSFITKLKHKGFVPDIIVVDYVNLIHPIAKNLNSYESVKEICEHLRALSFKHSLPIVSATQIGRCLSVETEVYTESGNAVKIKDVKVGDIIKGKSGNVVIRHVYPTEKKKVYKIKTETGKQIICSKEHVFPTSAGNKSISTGLTVNDLLFTVTQ